MVVINHYAFKMLYKILVYNIDIAIKYNGNIILFTKNTSHENIAW